MCGRYTLTLDVEELRAAFAWLKISQPDEIKPRYNIAPTQKVAVVASAEPSALAYYQWGLIPSWAKSSEIGSRLINARAETVAEKPTFRHSFRQKRCLILADGFFEWQASADGSAKTPMYIRMENREPFAFAGLWDAWQKDNDTEIRTCTIITTQPNDLMKPIHNRMPVILPIQFYQAWLEPGTPANTLRNFLRPFPASEMIAYPVSRLVNSPHNDREDCIKPAPGTNAIYLH